MIFSKGKELLQKPLTAKPFSFVPPKAGKEFKSSNPAGLSDATGSWASALLPGVFTAAEALDTLKELGQFIRHQDMQIQSLEMKKGSSSQLASLQMEVDELKEQLEVVVKEKSDLEEEAVKLKAELRGRSEELLWTALEFGTWADGLKSAVDGQFKYLEDSMG